jgi:hypothetical protein
MSTDHSFLVSRPFPTVIPPSPVISTTECLLVLGGNTRLEAPRLQ